MTGLRSVGTLGNPNDPNDPNAVVQIDGSLTSDGHVVVGASLRGCLEVRGDVHKTTVGPAIRVGGDVTGQIRVYGSLYDDVNEPYEINVRGAMPFPGAIAIDMALNDVLYGTSNYAAAYPGLEGSMLYHADADCSGQVDSGDINPFIARVTTGNCDCDQPRGDAMGGEDADLMPPEELAAVLAENTAPEQYDALLAIIGAAIDAAPDEETQAYWQAVYAALTQ